MSAASRLRERQRSLEMVEAHYGPFPDPGAAPPPLDEDLERLLGWYCRNKRELEEEFGIRNLVLTDEDNGKGGTITWFSYVPSPKNLTAQAALAAAMLAADANRSRLAGRENADGGVRQDRAALGRPLPTGG